MQGTAWKSGIFTLLFVLYHDFDFYQPRTTWYWGWRFCLPWAKWYPKVVWDGELCYCCHFFVGTFVENVYKGMPCFFCWWWWWLEHLRSLYRGGLTAGICNLIPNGIESSSSDALCTPGENPPWSSGHALVTLHKRTKNFGTFHSEYNEISILDACVTLAGFL